MATGLIDFHNHFVGGLTSEAATRWPLLADEQALERSLEAVNVRIVSTPLEFVPGVPAPCINESIAGLVSRHRDRLIGLASVDAYGGAAAAEELTRAVKTLDLRGVFIESARGELLPDCEQAQPVFAAAASLGVPVFLHPVPDLPLRGRFKSERFARGTINSAAVLAMIAAAMFEKHDGLKVVITALALLGPRRVVAGTDWPVVQEAHAEERLSSMLSAFGLSSAERDRVAAGNARELLQA